MLHTVILNNICYFSVFYIYFSTVQWVLDTWSVLSGLILTVVSAAIKLFTEQHDKGSISHKENSCCVSSAGEIYNTVPASKVSHCSWLLKPVPVY